MARKPKCEKADDTHQDRHTLERLHPECAAGQPPGRQASESPARLNGLVPSEAIFHAVVDHIPDAVSIYDSALRLQYVNAAGCRLCDRPLSDFVGKREEEVWPEDVYKHYVPHLREAVRTKTPQRFETTLTFPNGRSCSQAVAYVPLLDDAGGLVHVMGITFDITDRKRAEQVLHESEERLRLALEGGGMGCWEWDLRTDSMFWDEWTYRLLGLDPFRNASIEAFLDCVHPDNRIAVKKLMADALISQTDFEVEFRIVCRRHEPSSEIPWVASRAKAIRDERGEAVRMIGVMYDITRLKRMEAELRRLNEHLEEEVQAQTGEMSNAVDRLQDEVARRVLAEGKLRKHSHMLDGFFRHTISPLAFMDRYFNFVRVNEAYAKAQGGTPEYFTGKNHFVLDPDPHKRTIFERVVRTRQPCLAYAQPFIHPHDPQRGATYWDWRLTPLLNELGEVQFLVLSLEDVTRQQLAMEELEHRARQLQKLALELSRAEDRERRRLAEILHDDLQQTLAAAKFHVGLLDSWGESDEELQGIVGQVKQMLKDAIEKSRDLSHELSPTVLRQSELDDTFEWLARQTQKKHGLTIHLEFRGQLTSDSEPVRSARG